MCCLTKIAYSIVGFLGFCSLYFAPCQGNKGMDDGIIADDLELSM